MASEGKEDLSQYSLAATVPIAQLKCSEAFQGLTSQEKAYAHYVGAAAWQGSKICLLQCSPESPGVFALLQLLFSSIAPEQFTKAVIGAGLPEAHAQAVLVYAATFLTNMGNYKSFGDTKFIPSCDKAAFHAAIAAGAAAAKQAEAVEQLWAAVGDDMFSLDARRRQLGLGSDEGISTYYSSNITKADVELVSRFMEQHKLSPYNTRLFKTTSGEFELRMAAAIEGPYPGFEQPVTFEGATIKVVTGDYAALMQRVVDALTKAQEYAANDTQCAMLAKYIDSFSNGSIGDHMDASRHWVKDVGPTVESYIGFIESYRDPFGVRGEWEGFVAVVNKATSAKFAELVGHAEALLPLLPWDAAYEKDTFLRPDFTSLEVVAFGSSGIPAGINIPNYDNIRQNEGFKNVSLGNVLSARDITERVSFLRAADQDRFRKLLSPSFEVQVGLHELLGHGSGKLFVTDAEGGTNFDTKVVNPETGEAVASTYSAGQTWDSVFSTIASSYEECRAECVGIYLCVNPKVLAIFGHDGDEANDLVYVNWLAMARAGLSSLMFYTPKTKTWGQAHMQARYAILQVMLECGVVELEGVDGVTAAAVEGAKTAIAEQAAKKAADATAAAAATAAGAAGGAGTGAGTGAGATDEAAAKAKADEEAAAATELGVRVVLHEDKIRTVGVKAVGDFLRKLQVYKSTADYARGKAMYDQYTAVPDSMLPLRDLILANRKPRPLFVQAVTGVSQGGNIVLKEYEATLAGVIKSFVERFPAEDAALEDLWRKDADLINV